MGLPARRLVEQQSPAIDELRAARARDELLAGAFVLGHREATRAAYGSDLQEFFAFCDELAFAAAAASRAHVDAYVEHLRALGASEATVARRLACLPGRRCQLCSNSSRKWGC